jgi:MYXO-CTERM domain-containing protein
MFGDEQPYQGYTVTGPVDPVLCAALLLLALGAFVVILRRRAQRAAVVSTKQQAAGCAVNIHDSASEQSQLVCKY